MKRKLYIFNENCPGATYGIGTYINQLVHLYADNVDMEIHIINMKANCKTVNISHGIYTNHYIYNIPDRNKKISLLYDKNIYYRNIFFLIRKFIVNDKNNIFLFCYNDHDFLMELVKNYFGYGKIFFIIHFFCGILDLKGNISYFERIVHSSSSHRNDEERAIYESFQKDLSAFKKSDLIICLCKSAADILHNIYGINIEKIHVINNGVEDKFRCLSVPDKIKLREKMFFESDEKIIMYVGRLDKNKGGKELILAFRFLLQNNPKCRLVIVGNGDESIYFEHMYMLWPKVTFTGRLPQETVYQLYSIADIGVLPSFSEQCSYVAIEMMMHGLPIVGTNASGLSEMIVDGENGYKVVLKEEGNDVILDAHNLSEKIGEILSSSTLQEQMSERSRMLFEQKYTLSKMQERYDNLMEYHHK